MNVRIAKYRAQLALRVSWLEQFLVGRFESIRATNKGFIPCLLPTARIILIDEPQPPRCHEKGGSNVRIYQNHFDTYSAQHDVTRLSSIFRLIRH